MCTHTDTAKNTHTLKKTVTNNIIKYNNLRVFTSNVRGLVRNWDAIQQIDTSKYDILLFNEIWQIRNFENLSLEGFKLATFKQRETQRGGGTAIYIRDNISFTVLESPFIDGTIETCAIKLQETIFVSLYRPPQGDKENFSEVMTQWIENNASKKTIVTGDFNLNYLGNDKQKLEQIEHTTGLEFKIKSITRLASGTCIDNVLTDIDGKFLVSNICIADHQGIEITAKLHYKQKSRELHIYREMKIANWQKFSNEIGQLEVRGREVEEKWNNLLIDIRYAVELSFPEKISSSKYKFQMSDGLLRSKHKKNKLFRQYKSGRIEKQIYLRYNKIYRKLVQTEMENNFKENLLEDGQDSKKKWKILKKEIKIHSSTNSIEEIRTNGHTVIGKKEIARNFKDHFETCADNLAKNIPNTGDCRILFDQQPEWKFSTITEAKIIKIIDSLEPKASCGFDLLSNKMLKKEKLKFSKIITPLINQSLTLGKFPEALKKAKVIPIFKKGDPTNLNNYRPISLLPVLSKVFEKVMNNQLNEMLEKNNLIDPNQYGFRSGHSTEDAIMKFVDHLEKEMIKNKHVVSIYIDVSKAFDSCDHSIIISKLKRLGLTGPSLELMKTYLKDRTQEIWVERECGGSFKINIGVGQGTILGPTLFKIYILDMYRCTSLFNMRFADDTTLVGSGKNKEETEIFINEELKKVFEWFCNNKLTLHPDKSRYIVHTKEKIITLKLGNKNIMRCGEGLQEESVKLLGILVDENLNWKHHINHVKKKISKGNYILWRYKKKLSPGLSKIIYESFVRCHLTYCLSIWGGKKTSDLTELKKLQKKIWTKIGIRKQHTNERLIKHNLLKLEDEIRIGEVKTIYRWEKNILPRGLSNIITERNTRELRNRQFIRQNNWKANSISYRLATRAMKEIEEISVAQSLAGLKKKYKKICQLNYLGQCTTRNCYICSQNTNA